MQIEKVNCLVSLDNNGLDAINSQIVKSGPSAISVTEIPLIQMQNGPDSVTRVHSAGFFESGKREELSRLNEVYPKKFMSIVYPGLNAPIPKTIADVDLPDKHLHDAPEVVEEAEVAEQSQDNEIAELRAKLATSEAENRQLLAANFTPPPELGLAAVPIDDVSHETTGPETKEEWRAALKEAGIEVPLGNFGIPALKAMMPAGA